MSSFEKCGNCKYTLVGFTGAGCEYKNNSQLVVQRKIRSLLIDALEYIIRYDDVSSSNVYNYASYLYQLSLYPYEVPYEKLANLQDIANTTIRYTLEIIANNSVSTSNSNSNSNNVIAGGDVNNVYGYIDLTSLSGVLLSIDMIASLNRFDFISGNMSTMEKLRLQSGQSECRISSYQNQLI